MFSGEKQTIFSVLALYLVSTFLLISTVGFVYFKYEAKKFQDEIKQQSLLKAKLVHKELEKLQKSDDEHLKYPRFEGFESAIFDGEGKLIFTTDENIKGIDFTKEIYKKDDFVYFVTSLQPYYFGGKYIVLKQKNIDFFEDIGKNILYLTMFILVVVALTSLFLVKLILKPIRDNLALLDRFIKDTTHELNTPLSTILTNIELLDELKLEEKTQKKLIRIKMASQTIFALYDDLVYLTLNKNTKNQNEIVDVCDILKDRIEYFSLMFGSKNLKVDFFANGTFLLFIDRSQLIRLVDNLFSNCYKYSKKNTKITVELLENAFSISDEGIGMSDSEISKIYQRYTRFDTTVGGFGIGYSIIKKIADEYSLKIEIKSKKGVGTCVVIKK